MKTVKEAEQEYTDYINEHIKNVAKAWEEVKEKCKDDMMKTIPGINYIKIVDKNYEEFFKFIIDFKNRSLSDDYKEEE